MQRKIWSILAFLFVMFGLCSCSMSRDKAEPELQTIEDENVPQAASMETGAAEEQLVYDEILDLLRQQTAEGSVSTRSADTLKKIFQCVMDDHPELFYVNGYQYTAYSLAGNVTRILIEPSYTMNAGQIAAAQKAIEVYVKECMAKLDQKASDYAKVRYLYEYVILNTEYNNDAVNSQNICSVFENHESVCQGYAKALQYLCQQAGIQTGLVNGSVNGVGHAWDLVKIAGDWYYVDVTLGDASYVSANEQRQLEHVPPISYDYLCVTSDVIMETHQIDNAVPLPECIATTYNYFVQENLLFKEYDEKQAKQLFQEAWEKGNRYLTIQCADQEVFEDVKSHLIDEQKVFSFVGNQESAIGYTQNDILLTLSFWNA